MSAEPVMSNWAIKQWKRRERDAGAHRKQRLRVEHIRYRERELALRAANQQAKADTYLVRQLEIEANL